MLFFVSKKLVFCFFLLLFQNSFSQNSDLIKIDQLLRTSEKYSTSFNNLKAIEFAMKASKLAEEINNSDRKAKSYLHIAENLATLDMYKESLEFIEKGLNEESTNNDVILLTKFKQKKAYIYSMLELTDLEIKEQESIISHLKPYENKHIDAKLQTIIAYANMASSYYQIKQQLKEANYFINKALTISQNLSEDQFPDRVELYDIKGVICLYSKKSDSAYFYFNKSYELAKKKHLPLYPHYKSFAEYYGVLGQPTKALEYYLKADENFSNTKPQGDLQYAQEINDYIATQYALLGEDEKAQPYREKYYKISKSYDLINKEGLKKAVKVILNEQNEQKAQLDKNNLYVLFSIAGFVLLASALAYFQFRKIKQNKKILRIKFDKIVQELEEKNNKEGKNKNPDISDLHIKSSSINEKNNKLISDSKEAELISKLEEFEKGIAFTERNFTQANLTSILETNSKYLKYILNEHRGKNFNDYINGLKIAFIIDKLYNNPQYLTYKINYLSDLCGFSSSSQFSRIFKQEYGILPSEFIAQLIKRNKESKV